MSSACEQFTSLLLNRRRAQLSLAESFHQAQEISGILSSERKDDPSLNRLLAVSERLLKLVERVGVEKAAKGLEPAYHNRQHFADAVLALSLLISKVNELSIEDKQLMLLAMLVHDFGHRGIGNLPSDGMTHEDETIVALKKTALQMLPEEQQNEIFELITGTTTNLLQKTNARYKVEPTNLQYLKQALINDADIATSYIPKIGPALTKSILIELGNSKPREDEIANAYIAFRKQFTLTSHIARSILEDL